MNGVDHYELEARAGDALTGIDIILIDNPNNAQEVKESGGGVDIKKFQWQILADKADPEAAIAYCDLCNSYVHIDKPDSTEDARRFLIEALANS